MTTNPASAQKQDDASSSTTTGWKDKACRVCDSFSFFKKSMSSRADGAHTETNVEHPPPARRQPGASHADADDSASSPAWTTPDDQLPCPPDYTDLGNSAWAFLHTVASYYPEQPEAQEQSAAQQLINAVARLYPCTSCAEHLREELHTNPPAVESRSALEQWMCRLHNSVNARLGKPMFDCSRVGERWRDGPPEGRECVEVEAGGK